MLLDDHGRGSDLTRRQLLERGAGAVVAASSASTLLAACGGSSAQPAGIPQGKPTRGGRLTVGLITGGSAETVDPAKVINTPDVARVMQLYDHLYQNDRQGGVVPGLAESGEYDANRKTWVFRLRSGVVFHDGKPLTADDVIYTLRGLADPDHFAYSQVGIYIDAKALRKRDPLTVEVPLLKPHARLPELLSSSMWNTAIIADGSARKPVGSGPFKSKSFTPGKESVYLANRDYWQGDTPYLDELVINSSFNDESARTNALLSGSIDVLPYLSPAQAKAQRAGARVNVLQAAGTQFQCFYMRVDRAPFSDVRVRQALRLATDRQGLVDNVLQGFGRVGNDLAGPGVQFYLDTPRERDLDQARSLLKQAGQQDLRVTLQTSPVVPGVVEAATLFSQQAKEAGVTVKVKREDPSQYFDTSTLFLKMAFAQDYYTNVPYLQRFWSLALLRSSKDYANETHWYSAKTDRLYEQANAAVSTSRAAEYWRELQLEQFNEGGYIIWGYPDNIDGVAKTVGGLRPNKTGNCDFFGFRNAYKTEAA